MKKTLNELWNMTRLAVACTLKLIGLVFGIPGRLLTGVHELMSIAADAALKTSPAEMGFGKFERHIKG